jgi:FtsP/CotA-like multicopper oxidase with cupredoxin domain
MAKISTLTCKGESGATYSFDVHPMDQTFRTVGGIYIITERYRNTQNEYKHRFIYIGQTEDFSTRFDDHHKADCFQQHSATCICTLAGC